MNTPPEAKDDGILDLTIAVVQMADVEWREVAALSQILIALVAQLIYEHDISPLEA